MSLTAAGERRSRWVLPAALLGAAALHLALGAWLLPAWTFSKYPDGARLLGAGRLVGAVSTDFSPLYLLLNTVLSPSTLRVLQSLAGALALTCVGVATARLGGRFAGACAALACAVVAPLLAYESTLEPDAFITCLAAVFLLLMVVAPPWHSSAASAGVGGVLGLSAAFRPTGLLLVVPVVLAILLARQLSWVQRLGRAALLGILAFGVSSASPFLVRKLAGGEVRTTMSVGQIIHNGNRPEGTGMGPQPLVAVKLYELQLRSPAAPDHAHELYRQFARAALGPQVSASETDGYWLGKVAAFAWYEPGALARLWGRKAAHFFAPYSHDITEVRQREQRLLGWGFPSAVVLGWLGLAGLLASWRTRAALWALWLVATTLAVSLLFFVMARYQMPALVAYSMGIGLLVARVVESFRGQVHLREWALPALGVVCLGALSLQTRLAARMLERSTVSGAEVGNIEAHRKAQRWQEATAAFVRAQAAQPYVRLTRDLRGIAFESRELAEASAGQSIELFGVESDADALMVARLSMLAGRCDAALPVLEELAERGARWAVFDHSIDPSLLAAQCLAQQGRSPEALAHVEESLRRSPGTLQGLAALAVASTDATVVSRSRSEIEALHDPISAEYALAQAARTWGRAEPAVEHARRLVALLPDAALSHYELAAALALAGRHAEAVTEYADALRRFPGFAFETEPLDASVRQQVSERPGDPGMLKLATEHAFRQGRWREAPQYREQATPSSGSPTTAGGSASGE